MYGEAPLKTEKCEYELHLDIFILILRTMLQLRRYLTVMQVCSAAEGPRNVKIRFSLKLGVSMQTG